MSEAIEGFQKSFDLKFRDGEIDVAICAGPRIREWPTQGARFLSRLCADFGLKVGWYGGAGQQVRGVMPEVSGGGVVWVQDAQKRIHRVKSRAVVRVDPIVHLPNPFPGWYSPALVPEMTAKKLIKKASLPWNPAVVILGSGNRALRFGTEILQKSLTARVICVESVFTSVQGWEVEFRRFLMMGGQVIFDRPQNLRQASPVSWVLDLLKESLEVSRVISVGPFEDDLGFREYPTGSLLIQWQNAESENFTDNVESMMLDEHRAVVLASRLIRGLGAEMSSERKSLLDKSLWVSKQKLKELESAAQKMEPFEFEGKWLNAATKEKIRSFAGTPKNLEQSFKEGKVVAAIDCIQPIACRVCERDCPAHAIKIDRSSLGTQSFLLEDQCTGCGRCVQVCPSQVPVMFEGGHEGSFSTLILSYREKAKLSKGDKVSLINRRGEVLAASKVLDVFVDAEVSKGDIPLYKIEVPSHLVWDARGIIPMGMKPEVEHADDFYREVGERVEVQIQGVQRRVREGQLLSAALFEIGVARPNDILMCEDGSCGLCQIDVDGVRKLACQSTIHKGMSIRYVREHEISGALCPCKEISAEEEIARLRQSSSVSLDSAMMTSEVGKGRCHGSICREAQIRLCTQEGSVAERYVGWEFPWMDWTIG